MSDDEAQEPSAEPAQGVTPPPGWPKTTTVVVVRGSDPGGEEREARRVT